MIHAITWTKRLAVTASFCALILTNILTLTNAAFNTALSGLLSTKLGIQTVSDTLHRKIDAKDKALRKNAAAHARNKAATRRFGSRLASRTKRVAIKSISSIPGEAIPLLGITLLISGTAYELYESCNSLKDLDRLYVDMDITDDTPDDVLNSVCNPSLPDANEIWNDTLNNAEIWFDELYKSL